MRNLDYSEVMSAVAPRAAVDALREVLKGGFDPATDPHRQKVALPHGEMHLLPSALDGAVGVKVLGIQPAGSDVDVPLVQGSYLLMGGETLTPEVVMDAAALTEVRTPAVAVAGALDRLRALRLKLGGGEIFHQRLDFSVPEPVWCIAICRVQCCSQGSSGVGNALQVIFRFHGDSPCSGSGLQVREIVRHYADLLELIQHPV